MTLKKRMIFHLLLFIVAAAMFFSSSFAYFSDGISVDTATFTSGNLSLALRQSTVGANGNESVSIQPGMKIVGSVFVENTGELSAFVRIKLDKKITLSAANEGRENEIDESLVSIDLNEAYWTWHDGYYYYSEPLESGEITKALFTTVTFDTSMGNLYREGFFEIEMEVEGVQANQKVNTAIDAVGWPSEVADED